MANQNLAILKAVVCVAWADGLLKDPERRALEGVIASTNLSADEAAELRDYAARPRTLADLDVSTLRLEDRRAVILHAVTLAHADREYSHAERQTIAALCERLGLSPAESSALIANASARLR